MWKRTIIAMACVMGLGWQMIPGRAGTRSFVPGFESVLRAHGGREAIAAGRKYHAEAVRLTSTDSASFIERRLTVWTDGVKFRRHIIRPVEARGAVELFDGEVALQAVCDESGALIESASSMDAHKIRSTRFSIETFGLLPLLRRIVLNGDDVFSAGAAAGGLNSFHPAGSLSGWRIMADQSGLVRRVEFIDKAFQYADYRSVGRLKLPYIQRAVIGDKLIYELYFNKIDHQPGFPIDHFKAVR